MIRVGEAAPDFTVQTSGGSAFRLAEQRGRAVVVYFYPKSFTPGCTSETRNFRDNYPELRALGAEVIGISCDDLATQCRFASQNQVTFPIGADSDRAVARAYGVLWPLLSVDKRVTVVIDEAGRVAAVFRHEFQVLKHLDDVLDFLRKRRVR